MHALNLSLVDVVVVGVIVVSTILAVLRGFVRETLSVFSWAAAVFAAIYLGPLAVVLLRPHISTPLAAPLIAYIGIFAIVLIPLSFVSHRLAEIVRRSPVGMLDRSLGIPFGIVRGLALIGFAYLAFSLLVPVASQPPWLTRARLLPLIQGSSNVLLALVPARGHGAPAKAGTTAADGTPIARTPVRLAQAFADRQKTCAMPGSEKR